LTPVRFAALAALTLVGALVLGLSDGAGHAASGKPEPGRVRTSDARFSVRVESRSRATVTLRWTPVRGVRGYVFFRDGKFLSRTSDPRRASATFSLPPEGRHLFEVQVLGKPLSARVFVGRNRAGCFSSPGACGYPDPAYGNVGVPAGTTLTPSGPITVTTPGAVINGLDVTASGGGPGIAVEANNVTIENTRVTCGCRGQFAIDEPNGHSGLTIHDAEISGGNIYDGGGQGGALNTLTRVYMFNCNECVQYADKISDSYFMVNGVVSGAHYEAFYTSDATVDFEHDTIFNPHEQTATVFFDVNGGNGGACDNNVTLNNSLLAGGGFLFYLCNGSSSAGASHSTVTNNRFARCTTHPVVTAASGYICQGYGASIGDGDVVGTSDGHGYYPNGGFFGEDAAVYCSHTTWGNNVWDDNNAPVSC
jgi:hypothetical protein